MTTQTKIKELEIIYKDIQSFLDINEILEISEEAYNYLSKAEDQILYALEILEKSVN